MSTQELFAEIRKLPLAEQRQLLEALARNVGEQMQTLRQPISEDEVERILLAKGIISSIPNPADYTDEDDDFEPIEIEGKPLSETIIEERR